MTDALFSFDDIVGLDVEHPRVRRFNEQVAGIAIQRPQLPSGLAVYAILPPPEAVTQLRTRMAAVIAEVFATNGNVTHDDLTRAGFTGKEIATHFTAARRAARVERMVV